MTRGGRGRRCARSARARVRLRAARPPRDRHRAGPDRHGGRRPPLRLALRLPEGRPGAARAGAGPLRDRAGPRRGARAGGAAGPGPRRGAGGDRLPARRPRPDLRDPQGRALPHRHLRGGAGRPARRRDPRRRRRCRCATAASRPASAARPAPPAATPAASSASTSSTRSRCSRSSSPSESAAEHERLLAIEERILSELEIPYRVVNVAVGDLGAPAAKKYDCEAWIPSQERYRELTSCSNTTDYQARRLGCRYRPAERRIARGGAHAERHRGRRGPHDHRPDRERQERDGGFTLPNTLHTLRRA